MSPSASSRCAVAVADALCRFAEAATDCDRALELDRKYTKAWMRRATARAALGELESALEDYKMVLKLEPANRVAKVEVAALPGKPLLTPPPHPLGSLRICRPNRGRSESPVRCAPPLVSSFSCRPAGGEEAPGVSAAGASG